MSKSRHPDQDRHPEDARAQPSVASLADLLGSGQLESSLRESALVQRALFEGAGDHVLVLEILPGNVPLIVDMNEAVLKAHGYSRAELLGQPITILEPEMGPELGVERERMVLEEPGRPFRGRHRRKDGSCLDVEIRAHQLSVDGRQFSVAIERDITDRLRAERALQESEQRLQHVQRMESLGRLAGGVAHDMNNVLAAILAVATQLHQMGGEAEASATLILKACLRGRDMVKDLLDFSRKEAQRRDVVDVHEMLRNEVKLLACAKPGKIAINLEFQAQRATVLGDASALSNALMNVCINAIDAMPDGGDLNLQTRNGKSGTLEILVEDTGSGMPPEVLNHAIEPFFTSKPRGKGTGLGLSIAYGIAKSHGGSLELQSTVGVGTTVRIVLPLTSEAPESTGSLTDEPAHLRALRVLLVDDDSLVRDTAPLLIKAGGHQVQVASSGSAALNLLKGGLEVDVVVLDLNMPGLNGWEVLKAVRELRPSLAVIITSGFVDQESIDGLLKWENLQVLEKPYSLPEIQAAFARI